MYKREKSDIDCSTDDVISSEEINVGLNYTNDIHPDDNRNGESIWNILGNMNEIIADQQQDYNDHNSNTRYPNTGMNYDYIMDSVQENEEYDKDNNDLFNPTPLPRMMSSMLPRASSAESASTTSTSNSVIGSNNHDHRPHQQQQQYQQSRQPSPQRRYSASASVGMVSVDEQNIQPNFYPSISSSFLCSAKRRPSASSSDSGAAGKISPKPLYMEVSPTPINPYHNHLNNQERHQKNNVFEVKLQNEKKTESKSVDELLAGELNKLSFKKRELINEEIHGVHLYNADVEESPEFLSKSFHQLDIELQKLRPGCAALDRSQRLFGATTYLNTDEFRIRFLRCDLFDYKKAASRLCEYAEFMLEIFGDFALQRRPYLTDLTDFEMRILEAGGYQVLPGRDRAGRRIIGNLAFDAPKEFGVMSRLRVSAYICMSFLEDAETQRKGAVAISWWHNVSVDDFIIRKKVHERINCLPWRLGAYHICIPSEVKSGRFGKKAKDSGSTGGISSGMAYVIKTMAILSVGSDVRPHLRFHRGSVVECIYALQSFGIHSDQIPVNSSSGKLKTKQHLKWLELRRLKEDSLKNHGRQFDRIIECPNQSDVLFGRGRPIMRHPGNAVLRSVVQLKLEEYASAKSKKQTTDVTWEVVRTLKGKFGARFLKEENIENSGLGWIEVSNETARQKVRIAFRDLRTKIMKTNAAEIEGMSTNEYLKMNETCGSIVKAKRKGDSIPPCTTPSAATSSTITTFTPPLLRIDSSQHVRQGDSSTSAFLGMDGIDTKRQRRCF